MYWSRKVPCFNYSVVICAWILVMLMSFYIHHSLLIVVKLLLSWRYVHIYLTQLVLARSDIQLYSLHSTIIRRWGWRQFGDFLVSIYGCDALVGPWVINWTLKLRPYILTYIRFLVGHHISLIILYIYKLVIWSFFLKSAQVFFLEGRAHHIWMTLRKRRCSAVGSSVGLMASELFFIDRVEILIHIKSKVCINI